MKYELYPIRASKVSYEDTNTELRFKDIDEEEVIVILPIGNEMVYNKFKHNEKYKLTIEQIFDKPETGSRKSENI